MGTALGRSASDLSTGRRIQPFGGSPARLVVVALALALVLSACGSASTPSPSESGSAPSASPDAGPPTPEGTLVIGVPSLGTEIFAPNMGTTEEQQIMDLVHDHLIRADPVTHELIPGLATSWSLSDDGLTWTFELQEGVTFHDDWGPFTAEDVRFTWSLYLREDSTMSRAATYRSALDGDIENFEIVDDHEFRVHTPTVMVNLPEELVQGQTVMTITSQAYWDEVGEEAARQHPVGTGPFKFVSHDQGAEVQLEAVPDHWRQTASFKDLFVRVVPDDAGRLAQVQSGDLDLAPITLTQKREVEAIGGGLQLFSIPTVGMSSLILGGMYPDRDTFDPDVPWIQAAEPEKGLAIRQAMSYAIDRQAILDSILLGEGELTPVPLSYAPGPYPFNDPDWSLPEFNPDRARELLAEGGYPDGFALDFAIFPQGGRPAAEDIAEAIAGMLENIGLTVNRRAMDFQPTFRQLIIDRTTINMAYQFTAPFYTEPGPGLRTAYLPTGALAHLHHPAVTDYVERMATEQDVDARMALARELGDVLRDEVVAIPISSVNTLWVGAESIGDWSPVPGLGALQNVETITRGN